MYKSKRFKRVDAGAKIMESRCSMQAKAGDDDVQQYAQRMKKYGCVITHVMFACPLCLHTALF